MVPIVTRPYLSSHHLWSSSHFAYLSEQIEANQEAPSRFDVRHRSYATHAVLAAVAFLEALINELLQDAADEHESYLGPLDSATRIALRTYWDESNEGNRSLLEKYQVALLLAHQSVFNRGQRPFQDVVLLVRLRNLLVHYRPSSFSSGERERIADSFRGKFPPNPYTSPRDAFFPDRCLGAGCARWAGVAARAFADEFSCRLGVTPNYQRVGWSEDGE